MMDRNTVIAIVLCFAIFLGWQKLYVEQHLPPPMANSAVQGGVSNPVSGQTASVTTTGQSLQKEGAVTSSAAPQTAVLTTKTGTVTVSNGAELFSDWQIASYRTSVGPDSLPVSLQSAMHQGGALTLGFDDPAFAYLSTVRAPLTCTGNRCEWVYQDAKVKMTRVYSSDPSRADVGLKLLLEFKTDAKPKLFFASLKGLARADDTDVPDRQLLSWAAQSINRTPLKDSMDVAEVQAPVKWIGVNSRYFLLSLINASADYSAKGLILPEGPKQAQMSLVYPITGKKFELPLNVYFGPKELNTLRAVEPTLDHTVDFGWFTVFAYPMLRLMQTFFGIFKNWGVSIILLTLLAKILTFPLTYKSMKNMKQMARVQPQLQKLREKYKDDPKQLNQEMMSLMKTQGYNPMAGCLPILVQMPIFFALYRVLYSSIELYHAPFALWIHDLAAKDPYFITPVLMTATMYIQQRLTPNTATDPAQAKMLQWMPVIFGVFMVNLPAGLTLYMLTNTLSGIIQQRYLNRKLDLSRGLAPVASVS